MALHDCGAALRRGLISASQRGREFGTWLAVLGLRLARDWHRETLAAAAPFVLLDVLVRGPVVPVVLRSDASIGAIAAVQGAVTGLSLIALVLAVELARRQEDRDDTVYEIMLRASWIRPMFTFALAALLATLLCLAIADFSVVLQETRTANLLLCAYLLTGGVGVVLLWTVLRTVYVLRPTGVIEYRFRANDRQRREEVAQYISNALDEFPMLSPFERLLLPYRPMGLTATERLFAEVEDALQSGQAARFSGALGRLRKLIENSADQVAESDIGFQAPGEPRYGYWFPLNALHERLDELWRAAFARQGFEFEIEMRALGDWLLLTGAERRSGELLEVGLRSGLIGDQAAREAGRSSDHTRHAWSNLGFSAWWQLRETDNGEIDPTAGPYVRRLIEHLEECGNTLLEIDDADSFRDLLSEFRESFYDDEQHRWTYESRIVDRYSPLSNFEYAVMALLALAGRAISLKEQGELREGGPYLDLVNEMVDQSTQIERLVPAACDKADSPLHRQWSRWESSGESSSVPIFSWDTTWRYPLLPLLVDLLRTGTDQPLPSLGGHAHRLVETWTRHRDIILELAGVQPQDREEAIARFERRLETAKSAETREVDDLHIAAALDQERVLRLKQNLRSWRERDRVLQDCFEQVGRVRRLDDDEWLDESHFRLTWTWPRSSFVGDVVRSTTYGEFTNKRSVFGFEQSLAAALTREVEASSAVHPVQNATLEELLAAVDVALSELDGGKLLIVFFGNWSREIISSFRSLAAGHRDEVLAPRARGFRQSLGAYKRRSAVWFPSDDESAILVVDVDRWGWLDRAPIRYDDFAVRVEDVDQETAVQQAQKDFPGASQEDARSERVRQLRLLVRIRTGERSRFEVEEPEAAWIIRVGSDDGDGNEDDS
ncbi:MAG: hypothetical protein OXS30_07675 [Chloroflexota bacterium]|nr:hypothetical protein [Chloroflexota bacterium]